MSARPRLVLHVGQHKTGTTSIQDFLLSHRTALSALGLWYPRAGLVGAQHAQLPVAYLGSHPQIPAALTQQNPGTVVAAIIQDRRPKTTMVLSSEVWWELLSQTPGDFDNAARSLAHQFDVIPLIFLRDPEQKSWSALKHLARVGPPMDVSRELARDLARDRQALAHVTQSYPQTVITHYDGGDSVAQFLSAVRPFLPEARLSTHRRRRRLDALIEERQRTSAQRLNTDLTHPKATAVTMGAAQALWDTRTFRPDHPSQLQAMYAEMFAQVGDAPELHDLPDEASVRVALMGTPSSTLDDFMTPDQIRDLARFWSRQDVTAVCARAGVDAYRRTVASCLRAYPARAVATD